MALKVLEVFAGYGVGSYCIKKAGAKNIVFGFSEIEKYAASLYENKHKKVRNYGDINKIETKELKDFELFKFKLSINELFSLMKMKFLLMDFHIFNMQNVQQMVGM